MKNNIAWDEFDSKMEQVFGRKFSQPDDLYYNVSREISFGEGLEMNDREALKYLQDLCVMSGELYVITDFCYYTKSGPFIVQAEAMERFTDTFYETYGETFYVTDIIIVSFAEKRIWVMFHEGKCWLSEKENQAGNLPIK